MEMLISFNTPFKLVLTNSTIKIETVDSVYLISSKHLTYPELGFVNKVKKFSENCGLPKQVFTRSDITYFEFNRLKPGVYRNVAEFDVNKAYWELARRLGYINEEIYKKGLEVSKMARLVALGSMATNKRVYHFNGQCFEDHKEEQVNPVTRSYFFHVSKQLDSIMKDIFSSIPGDRKYFYWVDAFFVDKDIEHLVKEGLENHDLEYKHKEVMSLKSYRDKNGCDKITAVMEEGRSEEKTDIYIKPFHLPSTQKKEAFVRASTEKYKKFFS